VTAKGQQSGSASRFEDEPHHGWSPDIGSENKTAAEAGEKAMRKPAKETDEGGQVPQAERGGTGGISPTDTEPKSPFGVGDSDTRRGEEIAAEEGKNAEGHKGVSQRPFGTTDPEDATGVAPQGPQHPDSPNMPPGDQGG
jgi:hypothetical protein